MDSSGAQKQSEIKYKLAICKGSNMYVYDDTWISPAKRKCPTCGEPALISGERFVMHHRKFEI